MLYTPLLPLLRVDAAAIRHADALSSYMLLIAMMPRCQMPPLMLRQLADATFIFAPPLRRRR